MSKHGDVENSSGRATATRSPSRRGGKSPLAVKEAIGDKETGYYIVTPHNPLRSWPRWSLRPYLAPYPNLANRWDHGGNFEAVHVLEIRQFVQATHTDVGRGVHVMEVQHDGVRFIVSIISQWPGCGHVSWWLDSLDSTEAIAFPEVAELQLAQMLHRRGFVLHAMTDDGAPDDEWIPVHVRGVEMLTESGEQAPETSKR